MVIEMPGYKFICKGLVALCFLLEAYADNSDLDNPRFIGYFIDAGKTSDRIETMTAPSSLYTKFTTSGDYAGPCPRSGSNCQVNTMCENGTLSGPDITNVPCNGLSSCQTMTILQTSPAGGPTAKYIFCGLVWSANTVYRELSTSSTTSTSSAKVSTVPSTELLSTSVSAMTSMRDLPAKSTSEADPGSSSTINSQAWVAGPVLGGVIALGLLVAGGFWWGRRYRRHNESMNIQPAPHDTPPNKPLFATGSAYFPGGIPMTNQSSHRETSMQSSTLMELGSDADTSQHSQLYLELPASPHQTHGFENRA